MPAAAIILRLLRFGEAAERSGGYSSERGSVMITKSTRKEDVVHKWFVVDAAGKSLGRLSASISTILQGKHKPIYTPHVDTGDYVVVVNCEKVSVDRRKLTEKVYRRYSGYPGGMKEQTLKEKLAKHPEDVIMLAVQRMLPKNKLGRSMLTKLRVFAGPEHTHQAQQPEPLAL
jgi:large subunit ribosomal protein L13